MADNKDTNGAKECEDFQPSAVVSPDINEEQLLRNQKLLRIRKAKSRDAARSRRGKENYEFYELAKLLPIPADTSSQLDKASIIRLTMSCLKLRDFAYNGNGAWCVPVNSPPPNRTVKDASASSSIDMNFAPQTVTKVFENNLGSQLLQCLDGFMFVLNDRARILYVSETVSVHLGLSQVELVGSSIMDFTHPEDHNDVLKNIGRDDIDTMKKKLKGETVNKDEQEDDIKEPTPLADKDHVSFFIRMKSTLARRGVNVKSTGFKVVHVTGKIRRSKSTADKHSKILGLAAVATPLLSPNNNDICLECNTFVTRTSSCLAVTYCEQSAKEFLVWEPSDFIGQNLYHCIHADDIIKIKNCHKNLMLKGQVLTSYYRIIKKGGGYVWMQSSVTSAANQKLCPDPSYIWINYFIGDCTGDNCPIDVAQLSSELVHERMKQSAEKFARTIPKRENSAKNTDPSDLEVDKPISLVKKQPIVDVNNNNDVSNVQTDTATNEMESQTKQYTPQKLNAKRSCSPEPTATMSCKKQRSKSAESQKDSEKDDTDFLDTGSQAWENPPNKEISNHNELPPGVKEMHHGLLTFQQQPTVVDHHYPFGINPAVFNANPLLAKMFSISGYTNPRQYLVGNPLQLMTISKQDSVLQPSLYTTPNSVLSVLEELKKDPLHRVNPPNKVVLPNKTINDAVQCEALFHPMSSGVFLPLNLKNGGRSNPLFTPTTSNTAVDAQTTKPDTSNILNPPTLFGMPNPVLISRAAQLMLPSQSHALVTSQALPQTTPTPLLIGPYYHPSPVNHKNARMKSKCSPSKVLT